VTVLDDLSQGHRESVPPDVPMVTADLGDAAAVEHAAAGPRRPALRGR
jgi:UDP-glucose 4-epimerase